MSNMTSSCWIDTSTSTSGLVYNNSTTSWTNGSNAWVINTPPDPSTPLPEPLKQIVNHKWKECWNESKVKCFSSEDKLFDYVNSLDECTVFYHEEISKKVNHKSVYHRFPECSPAGFILGNDDITTIFLVNNKI